jgi:hypothetical protein
MAQQSHSSQTYVGVSGAKIVGFYSIVVGEVQHADAPEHVINCMPRHPIPLLVLARLAVHSEWQGRRLGAGVLHDALARTYKSPTSSAFVRSPSMRKTRTLLRSTGISDLCRPTPIRTTCSC